MKKILLFSVLIALGFAGGTIMPRVWAHSTISNDEKNCNCGCDPTKTQVMVMPSGSEMMLLGGLVDAISNDSDGSLSKEELLALFDRMQKEYSLNPAPVAVKGTASGLSGTDKSQTVSSYFEYINRFRNGSVSTKSDIQIEHKPTTITTTVEDKSTSLPKVSSAESEETKQTSHSKKTHIKNNNGLGNGSEQADGSSADIKGVDPSNPGRGQDHSISGKNKSKKEKVKNNNGLGNGSEPADGTTTDIKGVDPSNPGKGSSNNNAGKKK